MSERVDRFKKRQSARVRVMEGAGLVLLPPPLAVAQLALVDVDNSYIDGPGFAAVFVAWRDVENREVQNILDELSAEFEQQKFEQTVGGLKVAVLQNIAGPFGVGKLVSAFDRTGGNVDTVSNARKGVYATDEEAKRFEVRGEYESDKHHKHPAYIKANEKVSKSLKEGDLVDSYTGEKFTLADRHDSQRKPSLDHVIAAKTVHNDPGRVLAEIDSTDLSNIDANLTPTSHCINSSIKDRTATQYAAKLEAESAARKARLDELSAKKTEWSDKERKEFNKLEAKDKVAPKRMAEKEAMAQDEIDGRVNKTYYTSSKFRRNLASSSATEGVTMGVQQALGEVLVEFFAAIFDEMNDLYRNGRHEGTFVKEAQVRFGNIAKRVAGKWERALAAFGNGFLSGLLSNLVTTLINVFVTTGKRLVRIIREGFLSLLRAFKLLILRPAGISRREALHEASKVIVGAGIVIGGIALEEVVSTHLALVPGLTLIADAATAAIVGSLTAIATAVAVYLVDQADLFGVNRDARYEAVGAVLDQRIDGSIGQVEAAHSRLLTLVGGT